MQTAGCMHAQLAVLSARRGLPLAAVAVGGAVDVWLAL